MRDFEVVIGGTIYGFLWFRLRVTFKFKRLVSGPGGYCYSRHNSAGLGLGIYPGWVVIQRTFSFLRGGSGPGFGAVWPVGIVRTFSCSQQLPRRKATVVIGGTIPRASFSAQGCY